LSIKKSEKYETNKAISTAGHGVVKPVDKKWIKYTTSINNRAIGIYTPI